MKKCDTWAINSPQKDFFKKVFMVMKITIFILLVAVSSTFAKSSYSQNTRLSVHLDNSTIQQVFDEIQKKSEFIIFYKDDQVNLKRTTNVDAEDATVDLILDQALKGSGLGYRIIDRQIVISNEILNDAPSVVVSETVAEQKKVISGTIKDSKGITLPGVSVVVKGTTIGTVTNVEGTYQLRVPEGAPTLVFSFVGMKPQEIEVAGRTTINVTLEEETIGVDEVVVIGYGTQSRAMVTTSITKLDNKVLENIPYSNAASALQGSVSGVLVQSTSGQPGAAPRVIIRGGTSINNPEGASPLYIIDGVICTNMNNVNSEDIESLNVLKDAASTSIYGARGSNGVVLITTKSGKSGQTQITYNYELTLSTVGKKYDMASARDYIYYGRIGDLVATRKNSTYINNLSQPSGWGTGNDLTTNTGFTTQYLTSENQHKLSEGWESMPDPVDPSKTIIFKGTDWQDVLFRTSVSHNHHISLAGGTDKATFNAGIGYMSNNGIAITTKYDRLSLNLNGELKVRDNLRFSGRTMYSTSKNNEVANIGYIFSRAVGLAPTAKYTFEDGTLAPGDGIDKGNPAYFLGKNKTENSLENISLSIEGHWGILPGLSFDPQISLYKIARDSYDFMPSYLNGANSLNTTRSASSAYSKSIQTQADAIFSYKKAFALSHNLDVTVGFSYFGIKTFSLSATGQGAATDLIPTLNAISKMVSMSGSTSQQIIAGYFGRVNYDFKQKYLASMNIRYDGASQLGASNKWGIFPGISLGWNVHKEDFWSVITENLIRLKLRGSYGVNGNISGLGDFQSQGAYSVGNSYMGASAIENTIIPNPNLKWEQSKTLDVGADIGIFNDRVNIIVDKYRRVTNDLLTTLSLPPSTGFSSIFTNLGSLENKGFEIEIGARLLPSTSDFQWKMTLNTSKTKHKILELPYNGTKNNRVGGNYTWDPAIGGYNWLGGLQEGGSIGDYYAWKQIGIYSTDQEALSAPVDMTMSYADKKKYGGDVNYLDVDKNDTINTRDLVYMGNPYPKWTGGISSSLSYKGFDLYVRMDYMTGHTIYNYSKIFLAGRWASNVNFPQEMVTDSWKKQGDIATRPQYVGGTVNYSYWRGSAYSSTSTNSEFYEAGDFLCIREITLSYNLPYSMLKKIKVKNVKFNVTGNNLFYFTKYTGMNPEEGGKDSGRYPLPRNIIIGAVVSF